MKTQTVALAASLALIGSGCDQMIARLTHVPSTSTGVGIVATPDTTGEPSVSSSGWGAQPADGRGFAVWTHQPALDPQHCNEFNREPAAETDDFGHLCETSIP